MGPKEVGENISPAFGAWGMNQQAMFCGARRRIREVLRRATVETLKEWTVELSRQVAPEEEDLAAAMMSAFLQSGRERERLFKPQAEGVPGGFGVGELGWVFPYVLLALQFAGGRLVAYLSRSDLAQSITTLKNIVELGGKLHAKGGAAPKHPTGEEALREIAAVLAQELRRAGLSAEQTDTVTGRVLLALLRAPEASRTYLGMLAERGR